MVSCTLDFRELNTPTSSKYACISNWIAKTAWYVLKPSRKNQNENVTHRIKEVFYNPLHRTTIACSLNKVPSIIMWPEADRSSLVLYKRKDCMCVCVYEVRLSDRFPRSNGPNRSETRTTRPQIMSKTLEQKNSSLMHW